MVLGFFGSGEERSAIHADEAEAEAIESLEAEGFTDDTALSEPVDAPSAPENIVIDGTGEPAIIGDAEPEATAENPVIAEEEPGILPEETDGAPVSEEPSAEPEIITEEPIDTEEAALSEAAMDGPAIAESEEPSAPEAAEPEIIPEEPIAAAVPAEDERVIEHEFTAGGMDIRIISGRRVSVIGYPEGVAASAAAAFMDAEKERYGLTALAYAIDKDGVISIRHSDTAYEERLSAAEALERDLIAYLASPEEDGAGEASHALTIAPGPIVPAASAESAEAGEWDEIGHSIYFAVSPYSYQYIDFYSWHGLTDTIPRSEFESSYGFGFMLGYDYRVLPFLSVGAHTEFDGYFPRRTILPEERFYWQIPLMADVALRLNTGALSVRLGVSVGMDMSYLLGTFGCYFAAGVSLGAEIRMNEHWSLLWRIENSFSLQPHPEESLLSSYTFTAHPAYIGLSYSI